MVGSRLSRHMFSERTMQPGFSSPARTRPSRTCSLKATTRSASSPPLVTRSAPMRMRFPLAPAMLRAGGWISAGMISTVQMPFPARAAMAPRDWPQRCAPSPESLITSTMCSDRVVRRAARAPGRSGCGWKRSWSPPVIARTGYWITPPAGARSCARRRGCRRACPTPSSYGAPASRRQRYSWMLLAASRPAPMASITVAAPVTMSPPE